MEDVGLLQVPKMSLRRANTSKESSDSPRSDKANKMPALKKNKYNSAYH